MPSTSSKIAASTHEKGDRKYASSSRLKMMLVARIGSSDESNERVLELAACVVELEQIELGFDDGLAHLCATILRSREREQDAAALLVRLGDALHAVDGGEHLRDRGPHFLGLGLGVLALAAIRVAPLLRHAHGDADL